MQFKYLLAFCFLFFLSLTVTAQKYKQQLQVGGSLNIPTSNLSNITNLGYGGYGKGMFGFSRYNQQITVEAGYNTFPVDKNLTGGFRSHYSVVPVYLGYRYLFPVGVTLESQAGISFNKLKVGSGATFVSTKSTSFALALGAGYQFHDVELGIKYQLSTVKNSDDDITFFAVRLAYNFLLHK